MSADTSARVHCLELDAAERSCVETQIGYRPSCGSNTKTTSWPHRAGAATTCWFSPSDRGSRARPLPRRRRPGRHCQGPPACANVTPMTSTPVTHDGDLLWTPSPGKVARANLTAFTAWLARERGLCFGDYDSLWRWSVTDLPGFWQAV